jgi:hypothetical protein
MKQRRISIPVAIEAVKAALHRIADYLDSFDYHRLKAIKPA